MICLLGNMRLIAFCQNMMIQFLWKTAMICLCLKFIAGLMSMKAVAMDVLALTQMDREVSGIMGEVMVMVMVMGMAAIESVVGEEEDNGGNNGSSSGSGKALQKDL